MDPIGSGNLSLRMPTTRSSSSSSPSSSPLLSSLQLPGHPAHPSLAAQEARREEIQGPDCAPVSFGGEGGAGEDRGGEPERGPPGAAVQDPGQDNLQVNF